MTMPTYFISHGGGPWPWMPEAQTMYAPLRAALQDIPRQLGRTPKAILMVSAHWEAQQANLLVASAAQPSMVYDYYGFPSHTYEIHYPAPGDPAVTVSGCGWGSRTRAHQNQTTRGEMHHVDRRQVG